MQTPRPLRTAAREDAFRQVDDASRLGAFGGRLRGCGAYRVDLARYSHELFAHRVGHLKLSDALETRLAGGIDWYARQVEEQVLGRVNRFPRSFEVVGKAGQQGTGAR